MNNRQSDFIISGILTFSLVLLGISFLLGANPKALNATFNFYQLSSLIPENLLIVIASIYFIFAGISITVFTKTQRFGVISAFSLVTLAVIPLVTLLDSGRWMASLGGFPIIGSGQGIIKYFALIPLVLFLVYKDKFSSSQHALLNVIPVAIVMLWIGGMKFYEFEAKGIESLVANSPLMSWMYSVGDLQEVSNAIGVYDLLVTLALVLGVALRHRLLLLAGILGCGAVFVVTQTFIFTTGGGLSAETLLTGLSQFIIKDLWLVANLIVVWRVVSEKIQRPSN
ncbi:DUF417 family protein [Thalassotalea euphylliae]|uniref:DUF417 family protein n=1 Tax=Thalassotalea euphylliae TaxID=1655234 RepID=UPI003635A69F